MIKIRFLLLQATLFLCLLTGFSLSGHADPAAPADTAHSPESEDKIQLFPPAEPIAFERPYFLDREEGWFWYIDPKPEKKKENKKKKDEIRTEPKYIEPKNYKSYWPDFKTSRDIQAYQKELLDAAVMDPSPEKVKNYIKFQQYIMSKSRLFTDVAQRVIWENPELDQEAKTPQAVIARTVSNQLQHEDVTRKMSQIAGTGGIFFFFSSTCPYCHLEGPILKRFEERYGIKVIAISLDGGGLPEYPNPIIDHGAGQALQIESTPTLFFGKPPKELIRLANGFLSEKEIEERLLSIMEEKIK